MLHGERARVHLLQYAQSNRCVSVRDSSVSYVAAAIEFGSDS